MSRFPKATETFILTEILELERLGHHVEIYALVREREAVVQPEAARLAEEMHDLRPWSRAVLAAQGYWLARSPRRYLATWARALAGNVRSPRFLVRSLAVVPAGAAIARAVVANDLDHIHAHWATHPTLAAWVAARLSGRRYTFTGHAHDLYVDRTMLATKVADAASVVTISEANRARIGEWFGDAAAARTVVIHCGVDPARFAPPPNRSPAAPAEADERPRPVRLLVVASLQPQKGHRFLVEACRILRDRGHEVSATFVGEGPERPDLERRIREAGLERAVTLAGAQPSAAVAAAIAGADIVVQPSVVLESGKTEGIPVALMEAMAAERPVVASRLSGIPELVIDGETGVLVEPGVPDQLATAVERLSGDPALAARLAAAGRARVLSAFDLHQTMAELVAVFRAAIGGGRAAV
jgi:glycosyltransferase involved in cell wall biosynthesis